MELKRVNKENVLELKEYFEKSPINFCDISVGVRFMWRDDFIVDYAVVNDTLILKESCPDYKNAFYYPMGENVDNALNEIENYCINSGLPLTFCCIDNKTAGLLTEKYFDTEISNDRAWSDYIYDSESFKSFVGKKYSGQRNHINKFKKLYPNFSFKVMEQKDKEKIYAFIEEFERGKDFSAWSEAEEEKKVRELIDNAFYLGQSVGYIEVDNKVVAISLGEVVKDTLIIHVEKGLKQYEGVYPLMANEFAKKFATDKVKYINREEDCGDMGLRISKLQYHPIEIKEKNIVKVKTLFYRIIPPINIDCGEIKITDISKRDSGKYCKLYLDDEVNKYYGYDYREDCTGRPTKKYFYNFMKGLKGKKEEYSFAVKKGKKFIGELVLYGFDHYGNVEIGFRFFKEYQGKGYAYLSAKNLIDYAKTTLGAKKIFCRCFKQNQRSKHLIEKLGFNMCKTSETHYFFEQ